MSKNGLSIFWFRRDLRLHDNHGLYKALCEGNSVLPIFIFDKNILDKLEKKDDARVTFLHRQITSLKLELNALGKDLHVLYGDPLEELERLFGEAHAQELYINRDYEPYARYRDCLLYTSPSPRDA